MSDMKKIINNRENKTEKKNFATFFIVLSTVYQNVISRPQLCNRFSLLATRNIIICLFIDREYFL